MAIEGIYNFVPVTSSLATSGQPDEDQIRQIAEAGYEVIINLGLLDPRYCLPNEAGLVRSLGLEYHHIPVNFQEPKREDLMQFFKIMDASQGKRTFVHCAANMRVSCFLSLYGQSRLGWTLEQADEYIKRVWEPNEIWARFIQTSRQELEINR